MPSPIVFISYSHDTDDHKTWVRRLATDLRSNSVDAILDEWRLSPGQDVAAFMQRGITESDRVLLVCTDEYVQRTETGTGGVGYERLVVTGELVQNIDTRKFIPLFRNNATKRLPSYLGPRVYVDFNDDAKFDSKLAELLRELLGEPAIPEPPLGPSPFSGTPPPLAGSPLRAGPTGVTPSGASILDGDWFAAQETNAKSGIAHLGFTGHMELRFAAHDSITKSQIELLAAVRESEIRTFGWPIGILIETRDEYRPRPLPDGIRAELAFGGEPDATRESYDYWALRTTGDFFLLQSLFEDLRAKDAVYFNTRIVRITEALQFASNLYEHLGVPEEARISVRVTHRGLAGRVLQSSSPSRHIRKASTTSEESVTELTFSRKEFASNPVGHVQRVAAPMFMLFDYKTFDDSVYLNIVSRFLRGEVT